MRDEEGDVECARDMECGADAARVDEADPPVASALPRVLRRDDEDAVDTDEADDVKPSPSPLPLSFSLSSGICKSINF
jgi:hypothetical protein